MLFNLIINPLTLPMVAEPLDWRELVSSPTVSQSHPQPFKLKEDDLESDCDLYSAVQCGGYHTEKMRNLVNTSINRKDNIGFINKHDNYIKNKVTKKQIKSINFLNKQKFKINTNMLNILMKDWENKHKNSLFFKEYNKKHPETDKLPVLYKDSSNESIDLIKKITTHNSYYYLYYNILKISTIYSKLNYFYFPTFMDYRGRIYNVNQWLGFQGNDIARSLILFYNGTILTKPMTQHVYHYIGNLLGKKRTSLNYRINIAKSMVNQYLTLEKKTNL